MHSPSVPLQEHKQTSELRKFEGNYILNNSYLFGEFIKEQFGET